MDSPAYFCHTLPMAAPVLTPSTLARDLPHNPVTCQVSPHLAPAVLVYEIVASTRYFDTGRRSWLVCESLDCLSEIQQHGDSFNPSMTDLRDATVAELGESSGLEIPAAA